MIVCICNNIRDRDVTAALQAGAETLEEVFAAHEARPQCRRCFDCIDEMIGGMDPLDEQRPCGRAAAACPC